MRIILIILFMTYSISSYSWWRPGFGHKWAIQYVGPIVTKPVYTLYNVDLFESSFSFISNLKAKGKRVICYFSGGSYENWRSDEGNFPAEVLGKDLDGWAGEKWLDIREIEKLEPIMKKRVELAKAKGCDGVDADNVNGFENETGFKLNYRDQILYNRMLAKLAHDADLAIGLKNDLAQIFDLVDDFDFAINEECFQYNECHKLIPFIKKGKPVFQIEYKGDLEKICQHAKQLGFNVIKKKLNLNSWAQTCW